MNTRQLRMSRAVLAATMALITGSRPWGAEPAPQPEPAQLQRNIHDIRVVLDRERAHVEGAARINAMPLVVESSDAPSLGAMREQLARSLERLENRCFGIDMNVKDGNAILICGNNNGAAENANVTSATQTTVVLPSSSSSAQSTANASKEGS